MKRKVALLIFSFVFIICDYGISRNKSNKPNKDIIPIVDESTKLSTVKFNSPESAKNNVTFSHFYERGYSDQVKNWNVSSVNTEIWSKYMTYKLEFNQGDMVPVTENFWSTGICHQYGIECQQKFVDNQSAFFGVKFSNSTLFPKLSFKGGYQFNLSETISAQVEIMGMDSRDKKNLFIVAPSITKDYSNYQLIIKPYYSASTKENINIIVTNKFSLRNSNNLLELILSSGYYPNFDNFLCYQNFTKSKYQAATKGWFFINEVYTLLPSIGIELIEVENYNYYWNVVMKMGLKVVL